MPHSYAAEQQELKAAFLQAAADAEQGDDGEAAAAAAAAGLLRKKQKRAGGDGSAAAAAAAAGADGGGQDKEQQVNQVSGLVVGSASGEPSVQRMLRAVLCAAHADALCADAAPCLSLRPPPPPRLTPPDSCWMSTLARGTTWTLPARSSSPTSPTRPGRISRSAAPAGRTSGRSKAWTAAAAAAAAARTRATAAATAAMAMAALTAAGRRSMTRRMSSSWRRWTALRRHTTSGVSSVWRVWLGCCASRRSPASWPSRNCTAFHTPLVRVLPCPHTQVRGAGRGPHPELPARDRRQRAAAGRAPQAPARVQG
jgi:hypothetical protein